MRIKDSQGNATKYQMLENDVIPFFNQTYWGHTYMKLLVDVTVPASGYSTYVLSKVDMDVPANSWALALREDENDKALMIITNTKHGFRGIHDSLSLTLIRSSFDPDPYPENFIHNFRFAVGIIEQKCNKTLINRAYDYNHNISFVSAYINNKKGSLPCTNSFMEVKGGSIALSSVKMPEESEDTLKNLIIRVYETEGKNTQAVIRFSEKIANAYYVDINENKITPELNIEINDHELLFDVRAWSIASLRIEF